MIQRSQQEMAQYIVNGLRQNRPWPQSNNVSGHDSGNEGDIKDEDKDEGDMKDRGRKARSALENILSVLLFHFTHILASLF